MSCPGARSTSSRLCYWALSLPSVATAKGERQAARFTEQALAEATRAGQRGVFALRRQPRRVGGLVNGVAAVLADSRKV